LPLPADVFVEETPYEERQAQAREIDLQMRKEDPDFKGAFHEKKERKERTTPLSHKQQLSKKHGKPKTTRGKSFGKKK
jgi:ATP-dependent RNA helicase RhlE